MSRPRALLLGGALLVLLLALTPLIPRGERDGGLRPSGRSDTGEWTLSDSPGGGRLTEQLVSEIDRVVAEGQAVGRLDAGHARQAGGRVARRRPGPLRRLRGPDLLPGHRLDHRERGAGQSTPDHGGAGSPGRRRVHRRPRRPRPARPAGRPVPGRSRAGPNAASSPRPRGRWPRCGCCATRSRECRCPTGSWPTTRRPGRATATNPPTTPPRRRATAPPTTRHPAPARPRPPSR